MDQEEQVTYPPLNTLKPVASEVWIVDGPAFRFGFPWPKMLSPTRMTGTSRRLRCREAS